MTRTFRLPDDSFTYGRSNRPSTPIKSVVGNFYGDVAEQSMITRYDDIRRESTSISRLPSSNRHTKASVLAKTFVKQ